MKFVMTHANINVVDPEKSIEFYRKAFGLSVQREKASADGSYRIIFLSGGDKGPLLELTWLRDKVGSYDLGDNESHIGFVVDDIKAAHALHSEMGCICYENTAMGIYFVEDPDGYWMEVIPEKR
jgi:lactoylglutathione lyase